MADITLIEYARRHGKTRATAQQRAVRGSFQTAHKVGGTWLIDEDEPWIDGRIRSGKYIGARKERGSAKNDAGQ